MNKKNNNNNNNAQQLQQQTEREKSTAIGDGDDENTPKPDTNSTEMIHCLKWITEYLFFFSSFHFIFSIGLIFLV